MVTKVVTHNDLGNTVEVVSDKLEVKISKQGGNAIKSTSDGLLVEIPEQTGGKVEVSKDEGNVIEQHADGLYATAETIKPVLAEPSVEVAKNYITLTKSVVIPSEDHLPQERAIIENRNGLNILHLDIKFVKPLDNAGDIYIGRIPSNTPLFNTLTEVQVLGGGCDGFIYVNKKNRNIIAKGTFPADKRVVVKLIGYTD